MVDEVTVNKAPETAGHKYKTGEPVFTTDGDGRISIEFAGTGFTLRITKDPLAVGYNATFGFLPNGQAKAKPDQKVANARLLASALLGLYELTQHPEEMKNHNIIPEQGIDISSHATNTTLIKAVQGLFKKTGHDPAEFAPVSGDILHIRWPKLLSLKPDDEFVIYLKTVTSAI